MIEWMDWGEFKKRIDACLDAKGKEKAWTKDICIGFAEAVCELEQEEGRPVYFGEVLYDLDKKAGAGGRLDEVIRHELRLAEKKAKNAKLVRAISAKEVEDAAKTRISKDRLVSDIQERIKEKRAEMEKWGKRQRISLLFQPNEPFLYGLLDPVIKKTVFEKMQGGKSEKNVALQFAKWLAQKGGSKKSYLELK